MRTQLLWALSLLALTATAAERKFDFSEIREGQPPPGFRSTVTGAGKPGEWKIVLDDVPPLLPSMRPERAVTKQAVLAQVSQDPADDHYPLLVLEDEIFGDFTLSTRFKLVSGKAEQMAGVAFRIQDEKNYCYVRASALGGTFNFCTFAKGELLRPIGAKVALTNGLWYELKVECRGSQVTCFLDGKPLISGTLQASVPKGKIGFWTKSDSVSYFSDTRIVYTPLEDPAQVIVRDVLKKYTKLRGLEIYVLGADGQSARLVASKDEAACGKAGGKTEIAVVKEGTAFYGKEGDQASAVLPLRDRNGEIIAAVRVILNSFPGQTEQNVFARATPIVRAVQDRIQGIQDLVE